MNRREFWKAIALGLSAVRASSLPAATLSEIETGHSPTMGRVRIDIAPTSVSEWDEEDELYSVLGAEELVKPDGTQAKAMLDQTTLELPGALDWVELVRYAEQHHTSGGLKIPPDSKNFSYYLIETPLTIILAGDNRLVRLRLVLDLQAEGAKAGAVLAYDVFPTTQMEVKKLATGEVNLDISKALQFVLTSTGAEALAPIAETLGFKLTLPFQWNTTTVKLQSSGRMSNPVEWYVSDASIQKGFAPSVILRAPKGAPVTVGASLVGETRVAGPRGWFKTQFQSSQPRNYVLK